MAPYKAIFDEPVFVALNIYLFFHRNSAFTFDRTGVKGKMALSTPNPSLISRIFEFQPFYSPACDASGVT